MADATLAALLDALQRAEGPSRELDAEIARALDPALRRGTVTTHDGGPPSGHLDGILIDPRQEGRRRFVTVPAYTSSLDAAMTLVPEGWSYNAGENEPRTNAQAVCARSHPTNKSICVEARTPALALTIAAIKAGWRARTGSVD